MFVMMQGVCGERSLLLLSNHLGFGKAIECLINSSVLLLRTDPEMFTEKRLQIYLSSYHVIILLSPQYFNTNLNSNT